MLAGFVPIDRLVTIDHNISRLQPPLGVLSTPHFGDFTFKLPDFQEKGKYPEGQTAED